MEKILTIIFCFAAVWAKGQVNTVSRIGVQGVAISSSDTTRFNAKQDSLNWYQPEHYGAVGNGTTDDAAAFTAMIAAMPARGGKVSLMSKKYLINSTVTVNKPIWFEGTGYGDTLTGFTSATRIVSGTANIIVFDVTESYCAFSNMSIFNYQSGTPSAGAAIAFNGNTRTSSFIYGFNLQNLRITGYYDDVQATNAAEWNIDNVYFSAAARYDLYIACSSLPDAGDSKISNCEFVARATSPDTRAGIYQESSGGLKIINCKWVSGSTKFDNDIRCHFLSSTVDLLISNSSFENYDSSAIYMTVAAGVNFNNVAITGNQFAGYTSVSNDIKITGYNGVSIMGNVFTAASTPQTAIVLNTVDRAVLYNTYRNYTTNTSFTSCTNYSDGQDNGLSVNGSSTNAASLSASANGYGYSANAYPSGFAVPGLAAMGLFGTASQATRGIGIWTNSFSASGSTGFGVLRGGGYDSLANKLYWDKNGVGISDGYQFSPGAPPSTLLHIKKDQAAFTSMQIENASTSAGSESGILFKNSSATGAKIGYYGTNTSFGAITAGSMYNYYDGSAKLIFAHAGTGTITWATSNGGAIADRMTLTQTGILSTFKGANVSSAASITPTGNSFHVTGTTTITSISTTGLTAGTTFTLIFDGALTFTDGSNLVLAGNFVTTADDTITLLFDGTNFYEIARSVNDLMWFVLLVGLPTLFRRMKFFKSTKQSA